MDFARRQLEKYGWSDGKGLGKHENGISQALKPKLKRSVTGIGHDPAAEFNEHWWSALYDKAAKNVEVEEKNGKTKKIKTVVCEDFTITNSTWRINKKRKNNSNDDEYSEYFVKKATLTNEGTKVENVSDNESEDDGKMKDVFKLTDEELFAACKGRTAHKGARHGLKALGKLQRIAEQEQLLLTQSKYEGYSHAKKIKRKNEEVVEDLSLEDNQAETRKNKKKKKRKRCSNEDSDANTCEKAESPKTPLPDNDVEKFKSKYGDTIAINEEGDSRKLKKSKKLGSNVNDEPNIENHIVRKPKNKKRLNIEETEIDNISGKNDVEGKATHFLEKSDNVSKKKKKKS